MMDNEQVTGEVDAAKVGEVAAAAQKAGQPVFVSVTPGVSPRVLIHTGSYGGGTVEVEFAGGLANE